MESPTHDLLIIGSGVAGLTAAVRAAATPGLSVAVMTKGELRQGSTRWAQGGVAAVLDDEDSAADHIADTLNAGAGLCDAEAVTVLVEDGPDRVRDLIGLGAIFDRLSDGRLSKALEGGHSRARVVHAGGAATGQEIERVLASATEARPITIYEGWFAVDLSMSGGRCGGVVALEPGGGLVDVRARHTLLAAGGGGQMFAVTTNPLVGTGDGIAMALRAGVPVADLEFMQFHPTALHHDVMPRLLVSEAVRGHGAVLRDPIGERFVDELQPRDIVARAITETMRAHGTDHVWLDATEIGDMGERFPTIMSNLLELDLDPRTDLLPVAPAAHYYCGGIMTDLDGASMAPGLWAAGEVACAGVHGANRLASNSLLDGMVFAHRAVNAIVAGKDGGEASGVMRGLVAEGPVPGIGLAEASPIDVEPAQIAAGLGTGELRDMLQQTMSRHVGVLRSAESLRLAESVRVAVELAVEDDHGDVAGLEIRNLVAVARGLLRGASSRCETRGSHIREDHPERDPAFSVRYVQGVELS